jgi:hypothetical protein
MMSIQEERKSSGIEPGLIPILGEALAKDFPLPDVIPRMIAFSLIFQSSSTGMLIGMCYGQVGRRSF